MPDRPEGRVLAFPAAGAPAPEPTPPTTTAYQRDEHGCVAFDVREARAVFEWGTASWERCAPGRWALTLAPTGAPSITVEVDPHPSPRIIGHVALGMAAAASLDAAALEQLRAALQDPALVVLRGPK
jgi:hypothetical protein